MLYIVGMKTQITCQWKTWERPPELLTVTQVYIQSYGRTRMQASQSLGQRRKTRPAQETHLGKTHTICSGYWKMRLGGSEQKEKGHLTTAMTTTRTKLYKTHSTILCHHWKIIKLSDSSRGQICKRVGYMERTDIVSGWAQIWRAKFFWCGVELSLHRHKRNMPTRWIYATGDRPKLCQVSWWSGLVSVCHVANA